MRRIAALILPLLAAVAGPACAREATAQIAYEAVTEEVIVEDAPSAERFIAVEVAPVPRGIAQFGPFRVLDGTRAAIVAETDSASPAQFAAMLRAHPGIVTLEMVEVPGTQDDRANLRLGRMLHARGIATHVPDGGSVRSGGVELFLAGVHHTAAPTAEFAVHSWADEDGRQPGDYAADAPENRAYLDYYREMGMSAEHAAAFYAMTNSVPFEQARWLTAADMGQWVSLN
ncbi:MAG: alpha/beta hydrolase [Novosphingobium sp.]